MEPRKFLSVDVPGAIAAFQAVAEEYFLKRRLYRLLLRGKGLEFEAYRDFAPDDDADSIDWKASVRANKLVVRQYRDERNLKIVFVVDVGNNMVFGSTNKLKCEYAAEVAAAFSHLIIRSGDKIGFGLFAGGQKEKYIAPIAGMKTLYRFMGELTNPLNYNGPSGLKEALNFILDYLGVTINSVVIFSDFLTFDEKMRKDFYLISKKFETLALRVRDPLDLTLPNLSGEIVLEDPATGEQVLVNPKVAKSAYEKYALEKDNFLKDTCSYGGIDLVDFMTDKEFVPTLYEFLKKRRGG